MAFVLKRGIVNLKVIRISGYQEVGHQIIRISGYNKSPYRCPDALISWYPAS
jgi:hypothetical protein